MRKILFLDIDGVLNSLKYKALGEFGDRTRKKTYGISQEHLYFLNKIIDEVENLEIVLSSSWRKFYTLEEMNKILIDEGFKGYLIDKTPETIHHRGHEIDLWLTNNVGENYEKLVKFVILDDDKDMGKLLKYLVKTSWREGLTELECSKVIEMFQN